MYDARFIYGAFVMGNDTLKNNGGADASSYVFDRLREVENHLNNIENSLGYRLLIKLKSKNIPFKSNLKKFMYMFVRIYKKSIKE